MKAIVNPFAVQGSPCIPDSVVLPSFKITTKARGVFSTGTAGGGFIIYDPFAMIVNDGTFTATTLDAAIIYTDTTYARTDIYCTNGSTITTGVHPAYSNSILATSDMDHSTQISANREFRLVGAGIKIKYVGSNFRNQGQIACFRNQSSESIGINIPNVNTFNFFMNDNYSTMKPVTRQEQYNYYVPDDPFFIAYNPISDFQDGANHYCMGFLINGGDTTEPQSWMYEAVAHFELVGNGFTLSKSEGDPVGHDLVLGALPNTTPTSSPASVEAGVLKRFMEGFGETTREVAYNVGRGALNLAYNSARNYFAGPSIPMITMGE